MERISSRHSAEHGVHVGLNPSTPEVMARAQIKS